MPIEAYQFKNPPAIKISHAQTFENHEARIWAGVSLDEWHRLPGAPRWVTPETGSWSKCEVVMLYRMHHRIAAVAEDAQTKKRR